MKSSAFVLFFLPFLFLSASLPASEITLTETVDQAWNNAPLLYPQLKGQKRLLDISESDRWRRFVPNEPQVSYAKNDDSASKVVSVGETVGFPGKAIAFSRVDSARLAARQAEYSSTKYDIARTVIEAYLDAATSIELLKQQKQNIADMETLNQSLHARYQAGMATQAETLLTDLQLRQQQADLATMQDKADIALRHFQELMGLAEDASIQTPLPDDLDPHVLSQLGDMTADQMRAAASVKAADAGRSTAFWAQLPDFNFGVSKNHYLASTASPVDARRTTSYTIGVTVPFFFPISERAEAERQRTQAVIDKQAAQLQLISAARDRADAYRECVRSKERLKELREKDLPYAEALMESTFSAYKSGKLGMAELVLARKTVTDLRAQDVQLRAAIISAHLRCLTTVEGI